MVNYQQRGEVITMTSPYDRLAGQGALSGSQFGVAVSDVLSGASGQFLTEGVAVLKKTDSQAWVFGDVIYWDDTNKRCDNTVVGPSIGTAMAAVAVTAGLVTGAVKLKEAPAKPPQAAIALLTENSTTIGGSQNNGFSTLSVAWNGSTDPSAAEGALLIDAIRECAAKINEIQAKLKAAGITL